MISLYYSPENVLGQQTLFLEQTFDPSGSAWNATIELHNSALPTDWCNGRKLTRLPTLIYSCTSIVSYCGTFVSPMAIVAILLFFFGSKSSDLTMFRICFCSVGGSPQHNCIEYGKLAACFRLCLAKCVSNGNVYRLTILNLPLFLKRNTIHTCH